MGSDDLSSKLKDVKPQSLVDSFLKHVSAGLVSAVSFYSLILGFGLLGLIPVHLFDDLFYVSAGSGFFLDYFANSRKY